MTTCSRFGVTNTTSQDFGRKQSPSLGVIGALVTPTRGVKSNLVGVDRYLVQGFRAVVTAIEYHRRQRRSLSAAVLPTPAPQGRAVSLDARRS